MCDKLVPPRGRHWLKTAADNAFFGFSLPKAVHVGIVFQHLRVLPAIFAFLTFITATSSAQISNRNSQTSAFRGTQFSSAKENRIFTASPRFLGWNYAAKKGASYQARFRRKHAGLAIIPSGGVLFSQ